MKLSIVIPVLDSHEIVRRQLLHFNRMNLKDTEITIVDDGSCPGIDNIDHISDIKIIKTNDTRKWTQPKARNMGASISKGDILLFTDIDHILTQYAIDFGVNFKYDYGRFKRELGILTNDGVLSQSSHELMKFGLPEEKTTGSLHIGCHVLSMYIKRDLFFEIGMFRENIGSYPTHDDGDMKRKLNKIPDINKCSDDERPIIYMFPNGRFCGKKDYNPHGMFHNLKRVA